MNIIFSISLRNLLRQKRRNILLGIAIAFGTMILVLANAFSHGISDVLFNKIVVYVAGHVSVSFTQDGNFYKQLFRDGDRMVEIVKKELPDITQLQEAIGMFGRAIGNGKSDNVIMVGVDLNQHMNIKQTDEEKKKEQEEYQQNFKMVQGDFLDLKRTDIENPVGLSVDKAKYLNVKVNDVLRVRFQDIYGQQQAARMTVVAIFKPANVFMSMPVFLEVATLKKMLNYGPHDIAQLYIRIKDAKKFAVRDADKLHAALEPRPAVILGTLASGQREAPVTVLCAKSDTTSIKLLAAQIKLTNGDSAAAFSKEGVLLAAPLAAALAVKTGDVCTLAYTSKYDPHIVKTHYTVKAIFTPPLGMGNNVLLVNEKLFYNTYYENWPKDTALAGISLPKKSDPWYNALGPEWLLLKRCRTTEDVTNQYREIGKSKFKGVAVDVQSMYESASAVIKLEYALNLITLSAVMVLFFIILIGVINTLRMTIRERTREIGTIRAIGMQKKDVRNSFILETFFLALFSSAVGTVLAFAAMWGLAQITIDAKDNPLSMLLVNSHLYFAPSVVGIIAYWVLILGIAVVTAWFPARRAANLSAAAALRHYE
jgi:ABC-type lipoprotein release transport system permease subunit